MIAIAFGIIFAIIGVCYLIYDWAIDHTSPFSVAAACFFIASVLCFKF